jgi:hypothetical protein
MPPLNSGVATCCTMVESCAWFRDLPQLRDRETARAYAIRLAAAPVREQHDALHLFDFVAREHEDPDLAFAAWREAWLRDHPDWP